MLKCGSDELSKVHPDYKRPKYLSVARFSAFPKEDELLFFGENVVLRIDDIVELRINLSHRKEIRCFVAFQRIISGEDAKPHLPRFDLALLIALIERQKAANQNFQQESKEEEVEEAKQAVEKKVSKYGADLFSYFCNNAKRTSVRVRDVESLPPALKKALFEKHGLFSLLPVVALFASLEEIAFVDLDIKDMDKRDDYFDAALECVQSIDVLFGANLQKISFRSTAQPAARANPQLQAIDKRYANALKRNEASIAYGMDGNKHCAVVRQHTKQKNANLFASMMLENQQLKQEVQYLAEMNEMRKQNEQKYQQGEVELKREKVALREELGKLKAGLDEMEKESNEKVNELEDEVDGKSQIIRRLRKELAAANEEKQKANAEIIALKEEKAKKEQLLIKRIAYWNTLLHPAQ